MPDHRTRTPPIPRLSTARNSVTALDLRALSGAELRTWLTELVTQHDQDAKHVGDACQCFVQLPMAALRKLVDPKGDA